MIIPHENEGKIEEFGDVVVDMTHSTRHKDEDEVHIGLFPTM